MGKRSVNDLKTESMFNFVLNPRQFSCVCVCVYTILFVRLAVHYNVSYSDRWLNTPRINDRYLNGRNVWDMGNLIDRETTDIVLNVEYKLYSKTNNCERRETGFKNNAVNDGRSKKRINSIRLNFNRRSFL